MAHRQQAGVGVVEEEVNGAGAASNFDIKTASMLRLSSILACAILGMGLCAQGTFVYHGDDRYASTPTWSFSLGDMVNSYGGAILEVSVAMKGSNGLLWLSIEVPFESEQIAGTVHLFLEDGSVVKCFDKGIRDHVDSRAISLYSLTDKEIEVLRNQRIDTIRFTVGGSNYTAENNGSARFTLRDQPRFCETAIDISVLFQK